MSTLASSVLDAVSGLGPAGYITLVIAVSVVCQLIAWRLRIPSILLMLLVGFGIGQVVSAEEVLGREFLFDAITLTVGIILFEGSMSLRLKHVQDLGRPVWRLCSVTVMIAWALITLAAWIIGFDVRLALLVGAILVVTGPTVIGPILRTLRPTRRVSSLLRWEGIVVDPIGAVLALLVFQAIVGGDPSQAVSAVVVALGKTILIAFGIGLSMGALLEILMRRRAIPDFLHGVVFLAAAITALVVSDALQPQAGLVTVTILGIYLGNRPQLHLEHVAEFKEHLQVLLVGSLFIVLAGRITPAEIADVFPKAMIFLAALVLVVRPVSVLVGLLRTRVTRNERTLLACMAPRGVVAAAVTSIFALGFAQASGALAKRAAEASGDDRQALLAQSADLDHLSQQAEQLVPLVFVIIVCTVAIYGFGIGRIAERLGLASSKPQGVVFVGTNKWVVSAATLLQEASVPVLVVARNYVTLSGARLAGLPTVTANILSEYAVKDMDLSGIGYFIACTPEDETNATAAREFTHVFGGANTFQLHRGAKSTGTGSTRRDTAGHLSARYAFVPPLSRSELDRRMMTGMTVKRVELSRDFTLSDFRTTYGKDAVILFVRRGGTTQVAHAALKLPQEAGTLIAMVPETARNPVRPAGAESASVESGSVESNRAVQ